MSIQLLSSSKAEKSQIAELLSNNRSNVLLPFVGVGILTSVFRFNCTIVFTTNFIAIIPLAGLLSDLTEILACTYGNIVGGLLNATFGNAVELLVATIALTHGEIRIAQTAMLGSLFSNLLLVLGCAFVAGGSTRLQQSFNITAAQTMCSMMAISCISLLIPAAFTMTVPAAYKVEVINVSRWTSVVLLVIYALYLFFQLRTHRVFFEAPDEDDVEEDNLPHFNRYACLGTMMIVAFAVSICAELLVGSIEGTVNETGLSKTFIGLILLPIVGNAAEHVTAIFMAMRNKLDLTISIAIGSSLQVSLFLTPFLVVLGWILNIPMSLYFHMFETISLFVTVFLTALIVQDGESNWFEGIMLIGIYFIIAIAFLYYPELSEPLV